MSSKFKVAVVGAGPAGCTLARLLVQASISVTVFERETTPSVRAQGGTLDLHTQTGQKALKEAGLFEEFLKYARYDGEAFAVVDKNLQHYIKLGGSTTSKTSRGRPEIDRVRLRQILVDSLPKDVIRWGCRLKGVDPQDLSLHFDHGIERGFDLVVGADGAWSKVRPVLSSAQPIYSGLGGMDLVIQHAEERYPEISKFVNRGSVFALSNGKGITLQQRGDDSLSVYAWSVRDENWMETCGYDVRNAGEAKKALREEFADWANLLQEATQAADEKQIVTRSLYMLPEDLRWEFKPGVTLIGDAAHLMTPFAGEGVNLALVDAMDLARCVIESVGTGDHAGAFNDSLRKFELDMFRRAGPVAKVSRLNMEDMYFTPDTPQSTIHTWVRRSLGSNWIMDILLPAWFIRLVLRWLFWW